MAGHQAAGPRRLVHIIAAVAIAAGLAALGPTTRSEARAVGDEGLTLAATYTYTVDPAANVVHVAADITATNVTHNTTSGGVIRKIYYTGITLPLPVEAINPVAVQDGQPVTITPELVDGQTAFFLENVDFAHDLFAPHSAHVLLTYDIQGHPPRDEVPFRVNAAYASFDAFGLGDPGQVTVRVVVPSGYEIDTFGDTAVRTEEGGNVVYTATDIPDPELFDIFVSARNDAALVSEQHRSPSGEFDIRSWPDDAEWTAFITDHIDRGVPALEQLIGLPWPADGPVTVTETVTPYLYGYAGWYDAYNRQLDLGEELDPTTIEHELSHAWFNQEWFGDRWFAEGLAQEYSKLVVEQLGETYEGPTAPSTVGPFQLEEWGDSGTAGDAEEYGYAAAFVVMDAIVSELGPEKMRDVFAAYDARALPYPGPGNDSRMGEFDWHYFLDLVDNAGSTSADVLFDKWVLTRDSAADMAGRTQARAALDALAGAGDGWAPPLIVRRLMSNWVFDDATQYMDQATTLLSSRDALEASLAEFGLDLDPHLQELYELSGQASDLTATGDAIAAAQQAVDELSARRDETLADIRALGAEPTDRLTEAYRSEGSSADEISRRLTAIDDAALSVRAAIDHHAEPPAFPFTADDAAAIDAVLQEATAAIADGDVETAASRAGDAVAADDAADARTVAGTADESLRLGLLLALLGAGVLVVLIGVGTPLFVHRRRTAAATTTAGGAGAEAPSTTALDEVLQDQELPENERSADTL